MKIINTSSVLFYLLLLCLTGTVSAQVAVPSVPGAGAGAGAGAPQLSAAGDVGFSSPAGDLPVEGLSPESGEASQLPGLNPLANEGAQSGQDATQLGCGQSSMAAVMQPLCNFYHRMLRTVSTGASTSSDFSVFISALYDSGHDVHFHRLAVMDLLVMDTQSVEFFVVDGSELKRLGVAPGMVAEMPEVMVLKEQLEKTLDTLPEGIGTLPDTMALAVWGKNEPPVGSIMEQPLAVVLRPSALVLLNKTP